MNRRVLSWGIVAGVAGLGTLLMVAQAQEPPPAPTPGNAPAPSSAQPAESTVDAEASAGVEVYNRGPIHEAFAFSVTKDAVKGVVVAKQPPEAIEENPPDQMPDGENVIWIPGYWAFDEERDDFLWVSGVWRDVPPGRTWVPGYWTNTDGGFVWVSGNWVDANVEQISYLPEPPASQEAGPSSPSPGDGYFWVPGNWLYTNNDYEWRPGYWAPHQRDWMWIPARYTYSPFGYVYTPGYWDYLVGYRGLAFAPVFFNQPGHIVYTPTVAIGSWQNIMLNLFVGPSYGWYYFGDYYGPQYAQIGFMPFYDYHRNFGYDPFYVYSRWRYGRDFDNRLVGWNRYFNEHQDFRPRRTFREQRDFMARHRDNEIAATTRLSSRIDDLANEGAVKFNRLDRARRDQVRDRAQRLRDFTNDRIAAQRDRIGDGRERIDRVPDGADKRPDANELPKKDDRGPRDIGKRDPAKRGPTTGDADKRGGSDRPSFQVRDNDKLGTPRRDGQDRPRVNVPDVPDKMRDIRPDASDGKSARIPGRRRDAGDGRPDVDVPRFPNSPIPDGKGAGGSTRRALPNSQPTPKANPVPRQDPTPRVNPGPRQDSTPRVKPGPRRNDSAPRANPGPPASKGGPARGAGGSINPAPKGGQGPAAGKGGGPRQGDRRGGGQNRSGAREGRRDRRS